jgi:peptide/nickel transport system permease protein
MVAFLFRRLTLGLLTVLAVATFTFALIQAAPGEPFAQAMSDVRVTPEMRTAFRDRYGLDRPAGVQYVTWLGRVARGDFGESFSRSRPVSQVLFDALPRTLLLMTAALMLGFSLGIAVALWQAFRPGSTGDRIAQGLTVGVSSIPDFWIALGLLFLFALRLRWFPVGGIIDLTMHDYMTPAGKLLDIARHLVLPATSLGLLVAAVVARHQRAALLDTLPEDFIRTARAKGLRGRAVLIRHAFRNALLPTITLLGLMLPALVGGAVFVEAIYSWPGLGTIALASISARDYPVVLGATMLASLLVVIGGVLTDVAYSVADPRIRRA